jgi:hypothetical protein
MGVIYNLHRCVNFEFEYLSEFDAVWKNTLGFETVAQGKMFDNKKTEVENLMRLSLTVTLIWLKRPNLGGRIWLFKKICLLL